MKLMTSTEYQPLQGARILVAEDDAILAYHMASLLRDAGAEVLGPATSLANTFAFARSALLSCAVLDVNLRRETVFPAAQLLRERCVRIIFHTSYSEPESLKRDWPDAKVLTKLASPRLLIQTLCDACRGIDS